MSLAEVAKIKAAIASIREEADFNRSWTDGRRGAVYSKNGSYIKRRLVLAAERDGWADAIERLLMASEKTQ